MGNKKKGGFYAVKVGRLPGVYLTWEECEKQVSCFSGAKFKKFPTRDLAEQFASECEFKVIDSINEPLRDVSTKNINNSSKPVCGTQKTKPPQKDSQLQCSENAVSTSNILDLGFDFEEETLSDIEILDADTSDESVYWTEDTKKRKKSYNQFDDPVAKLSKMDHDDADANSAKSSTEYFPVINVFFHAGESASVIKSKTIEEADKLRLEWKETGSINTQKCGDVDKIRFKLGNSVDKNIDNNYKTSSAAPYLVLEPKKRKNHSKQNETKTSKRIKPSDISCSPTSPDRPIVFTDGSCTKNGRKGAVAGIGVFWGHNHPNNISERLEGLQTNNRAEITAAIRGLQSAIKAGYKKVEIKTDSQYTIDAITSWIKNWKRNGWKTINKQDVKNKEDFQLLDSLCQQIQVKWTHVKGHVGIGGNEEADKLARLGGQKTSHM